jgi:hypothetical protein
VRGYLPTLLDDLLRRAVDRRHPDGVAAAPVRVPPSRSDVRVSEEDLDVLERDPELVGD